MTVINIHSSAIRGLVREVTRKDGELDAAYSRPDVAGRSEVVDEYCDVLAEVLAHVRRYSALVAQDTAMVESVVAGLAAADDRASSAMAAMPGSMRAV